MASFGEQYSLSNMHLVKVSSESLTKLERRRSCVASYSLEFLYKEAAGSEYHNPVDVSSAQLGKVGQTCHGGCEL